MIITSDTMRRDRVGIYGGGAKTPVFDDFARRNLYFDRAFTQSPWTKPAIATLFTSLYPSQHRLASHPELRKLMRRDGSGDTVVPAVDVLGDDLVTLAEVMQQEGYRTAAFISNPWLDGSFGFGQGFERYDDSFARWDLAGEDISEAGLEWIESLGSQEPFFLYLHVIDSHRPYGKLEDADVLENIETLARDIRPVGKEARGIYWALVQDAQQEFSEQTIEQLKALGPSRAFIDLAYDRGVEAFDRTLAVFLEGFSSLPAYDRTAIIVLSDHGEALFERGYGNHGWGLFDDEAAIPMAAKLPGVRVENPRVECAVGLIDLMPTLCAYLDMTCPERVFGQSFIPAAGGAAPAGRYVVTEGVLMRPRNRAIRNRTYKLLWEPGGSWKGKKGYSLYNVAEDAEEKRNLLAPGLQTEESSRVAEIMKRRLDAAVPAFDRPAAEYAPLDPELEARLRTLGYLD